MINYEQRLVWARERTRVGLGDDALDATRHPAAARLDKPTVLAMLLPPDPLAPALGFTDVLSVLPQQLSGEVTGRLALTHAQITGQHASWEARTSWDAPCKAMVGVARHGGAFAGIGLLGTYEANGYRIYRLGALAAAVRATLETQRWLLARHAGPDGLSAGPYELTVAAPAATGALLGGYAAGWQDVEQIDDPPMCTSGHPLARLEIERFPSGEHPTEPAQAVADLLAQAMSRVVNIFGTGRPLYEDMNAPGSGVAQPL